MLQNPTRPTTNRLTRKADSTKTSSGNAVQNANFLDSQILQLGFIFLLVPILYSAGTLLNKVLFSI